MDDMGFETLGFAGSRVDEFQPEDVNWGQKVSGSGPTVRCHGRATTAIWCSTDGSDLCNPQGLMVTRIRWLQPSAFGNLLT